MAPDNPDIPEGSVVNGEILITSYFDPEGRLKYAVDTDGPLNLAQALGLLVLSGISIYKAYIANEPYEPDDDEQEDDDGE